MTAPTGAAPTGPAADGPASTGPAAGGTGFSGRTATSGVRWTLAAVVGRQGFQMVGALVLARLLGPDSYGVISAATIYITLTTLVLDQGLAPALVQRRTLERMAPGAVATANILTALLVGVLTFFFAGALADFFDSPPLTGILQVLGFALVIKALAITPRAMLSRDLRFKPVAVADLGGALLGTVAAITAALLGVDYHAVLFQVLVTDAVIAIVLWTANHGPVPNLRFGTLREILPFGLRVFATNCIAYLSRNTDNILVARVLGVTALSFYAMAYRVLSIPIQMIGQTVNRIMFPVLSRVADRRDLLAFHLRRTTATVALVTVPSMAFLACAAPALVHFVLGAEWAPTAALLSVLALAGARETIFYITPALMKATGNASMNLRFELVSTAVQVAGIVVGLQFGLLGVAVGYAVGGLLLSPLLLWIQRRLTGLSLRQQLGAIGPALHASAWASAAFLLLGLIDLPRAASFGVSAAGYLAVLFAVLVGVHHTDFGAIRTLATGRRPAAEPAAVSS